MTTEAPSFPLPLVHLNGSGFDNLRSQYSQARDACRELESRLRDARPHGRDYYVIDGDAFTKARAEADRIEACLAEVRAYLDTQFVNVLDQKRR